MASRLEAIALGLEAIAIRLGAFQSRIDTCRGCRTSLRGLERCQYRLSNLKVESDQPDVQKQRVSRIDSWVCNSRNLSWTYTRSDT